MAKSNVVTLTGVVKGHRDISPTNPNRAKVSAYIPVEELRKLDEPRVPWVNPRIGFTDEPGADKSRVRKDIKDSLNEKDGKFHERHLGVQLVAEDAVITDGHLTVTFGGNGGLGNGGTTTRVVCSMLNEADPFVQSADAAKRQYVKIEVYVGDYKKPEISDLVLGWNTNLQVDDFSMANQRGEFKAIKDAIKSHANFPTVAYFFGDSGELTIEQVLQMLCLFTMDEARAAYAGVGCCLRFYQSEEGREKIMKILPLVFDVIRLSEVIAVESPDVYNAATHGKFMAMKMNTHAQHTSHLPLLNMDIPYTANKAWLLPVLAAFRGVLNLDGPTAKWTANPIALFRDMGGKLLTATNRCANNNETLSAIGRSPELYELLEVKVAQAAKLR